MENVNFISTDKKKLQISFSLELFFQRERRSIHAILNIPQLYEDLKNQPNKKP